MAAFRGNHPAKVDEKGRLKLPSAFKALLDAEAVARFFITSTDGKRAEIWPMPEWEAIEARLEGASPLDPAIEEYLNLVNFYGQEVEMDGQGRVLLPQILRQAARLDGEVTVMGQRKFLAVHNMQLFMDSLPTNGLSRESRERVNAVLTGQGN